MSFNDEMAYAIRWRWAAVKISPRLAPSAPKPSQLRFGNVLPDAGNPRS